MDPRRFLSGTIVTVTFAFALSGCAIFRGADRGVEPRSAAAVTGSGLVSRAGSGRATAGGSARPIGVESAIGSTPPSAP